MKTFLNKSIKIYRNLLVLLILLHFNLGAEPPNPQTILEIWDKEVSTPDGMLEWKLKEEPPGLVETDFVVYSDKNTHKLFIQKNPSGDPIAKILVRMDEDLLLISKKNVSTIEKLSIITSLDQNLKGTSLSLFEVVGFSLEKNFLVRGIQPYNGKEKQYWKLDLKPLFQGVSGVVLYSEKESLKPYRLDLYSEKGSLDRIVRFFFGTVNIESKGKKEAGSFLKKIESTNMNTGKKSEIYLNRLVRYPPVPQAAFQRNGLDF